MGEATLTNSKPAEMVVKKSRPERTWFDMPLIISIFTLIVFGLLMVYSASWSVAIRVYNNATFILGNQIRWAVVGIIIAFIVSFIDYHRYQRFAILILIATITLLVIVFFVSSGGTGYNRTLFNGSIQPSELAHLSLIIYLSAWLCAKRELLAKLTFGLFPMMAIIGFIAVLIIAQPDMSAGITIIVLGMLLFFLAGGEIRHMVMLGLIAIGMVGFLMLVSSTANSRIMYYIKGLIDPEQASYHIQRCTEAIVRGGFFGVGIGKGTTKFTNLPFPWTDSIFAIIAEETGLFGGISVILLFVLILWRGIRIARRAPDMFGQLLASGITLWIILEAFINIGVMVNLVPFAGNALPFISAGGSNMVTALTGVGILLNIGRAKTKVEDNDLDRRGFSAIIDLRRRDRRRRVPRYGHPASTR